MSIRSVNREIRSATADRIVTGEEAQKILDEANKGPVTPGETKAIAQLFEDSKWTCPPAPEGAMGGCHMGRYQMDGEAGNKLNDFFLQNMVPTGDAAPMVKDKILKAIENGFGEQLAVAPDTKHLHEVFLKDQRMVDGPRLDAFVDPQKQEAYLKVTGAGMAGPDTVGPYWHGPISLKEDGPAPGQLSIEKLTQIKNAFDGQRDSLDFKLGLEPPLGVVFKKVLLEKEPGFDTYSYYALIPNGGLHPNATPQDPNDASYVFIQREGGLAGISALAGPVQLADPNDGPSIHPRPPTDPNDGPNIHPRPPADQNDGPNIHPRPEDAGNA